MAAVYFCVVWNTRDETDDDEFLTPRNCQATTELRDDRSMASRAVCEAKLGVL
jgi:hypothetical protein